LENRAPALPHLPFLPFEEEEEDEEEQRLERVHLQPSTFSLARTQHACDQDQDQVKNGLNGAEEKVR
jgi:hypothetical protein